MPGMRPLTDEEVETILASFVGRHALRDRALFMLGIKTGYRISELLSLKVGDVVQGDKFVERITVARKHMKRKRQSRAVLLHPDAREALQSYLAARPDASPKDPLFASQKGGPIRRQHAWTVLHQAYQFLEIDKGVGTHGMRKTFANKVYDRLGHDLFRTQKALDHTDIRTTVRYLAFREEDIDEAILGI